MSTHYQTFNNQHVTKCPICLESVDIETGVYTFVCGHKIHVDCTHRYVEHIIDSSYEEIIVKCPICRSSLSLENTKNTTRNDLLTFSLWSLLSLSCYYVIMLLVQKFYLSS